MKTVRFTSFLKLSLCAAAIFASAALYAADISGSWMWTTPGRNGGPDRTNTLTLKVDGSKVSGDLATPGRNGKARHTDISNGKIDGDNLSFDVVREGRNGNSSTNSFHGTVAGDTITGKMEYTRRNGETASRDWEAKRSAASNDNK